MTRYLARKLVTYAITFFAAVTIDWMIPHLMPGDPILQLLNRISVRDEATAKRLYDQFARAFRTDLPLWKQYYYFWDSLFHRDLGISMNLFPMKVTTLIADAAPYTLALLLPAILLSWYVGNKVGAMAARRKVLDNTVLPVSYALTATPYLWFAMMFAWLFACIWKLFPASYGYDP
ncbi:MAG: ABC transporter permease family protein, partial [Gaiellaceae bacterium]